MSKKKIQVMLDDDMKAWCENEAKLLGLSLSSFVGFVLSQYKLSEAKRESN